MSCPAELKCHCRLQASQLTHAEGVTGGKVLLALQEPFYMELLFFFLVWFSVKTLVSPCHSSLCASSFHWRARGSTAAMSKLLRCICSSSDILFQRGACRKNPGRRNFRTFSALWDENASKGRNYYLKLPDLFSYFPLWPWPTYCPCFRFFLCPLLKTQSITRDFGQDLTLERHS